MINNVVLVSGVQQSDSVIHIYVAVLFQILFPVRLLHNIDHCSLCLKNPVSQTSQGNSIALGPTSWQENRYFSGENIKQINHETAPMCKHVLKLCTFVYPAHLEE